MLKNLSLVKKFTSFNNIQNLWHRASIHTSAALAVKESELKLNLICKTFIRLKLTIKSFMFRSCRKKRR